MSESEKRGPGNFTGNGSFGPNKPGLPGGWGAEKLRNYREVARKIRDWSDDGTRLVRLSGRFLGIAERIATDIERTIEAASKPGQDGAEAPPLEKVEMRELAAILKDVTTATAPVIKELYDRGWGKAVQTIDLHVEDKPTVSASPDWDAMPIDERRRLLEAAEALAALADGNGSTTEH